MRMSVGSLDDVRVPVFSVQNGQPYNPTADTVEMAFPAVNNTTTSTFTWNAATWETSISGGITTYFAVCLVGTGDGGVALPVGRYQPWVQVHDNPTVPVMPASDILTIY